MPARGHPRLSNCRSVPCSRSPANRRTSSAMNSGTSTCSVSAAVISPKRSTAVRSAAGRSLVLLVRLEPDHAHIRVDAGVDHRAGSGLEGDAVVRAECGFCSSGSALARVAACAAVCCRATSTVFQPTPARERKPAPPPTAPGSGHRGPFQQLFASNSPNHMCSRPQAFQIGVADIGRSSSRPAAVFYDADDPSFARNGSWVAISTATPWPLIHGSSENSFEAFGSSPEVGSSSNSRRFQDRSRPDLLTHPE